MAGHFAKRAVKKEKQLATKEAVVQINYNVGKVLQYKDLPKRIRRGLYDPDWLKFQTNVIEYAKKTGYAGVTKPYKTTNPFTKKTEVIMFEKSPVKSVKEIQMVPALVEGTEEKLINIVRKDQNTPADIEAFGSAMSEGKVYGKPYVEKAHKFAIPGSKKKLKTYGAPFQAQAKGISIRAIQSRESLSQATNLTPKQIDEILGGAKFVRTSFGARLPKDPIDFYMQTLKGARQEFFAGRKKSALESGKRAAIIKEYYKGFDWGKAIREYKPSLEIKTTGPNEAASSSAFTKFIERPVIKTGAGLGLGTTKTEPKEERKQSFKSATSSPYRGSAVKSVYGSSYKQSPVVKQESVFDSIFGSTKSASSTFKQHSPKSPSVSSANSLYSPKSPASIESIFSLSSPKSPASPKSIFSIRSPESPPSPKSKKSPPSPGSPLRLGSPGSPLSQFSIKPPPIKIPPPPPPPEFPNPFIKTRKEKRIEEDEKGRYNFLGNVPTTELEGVFKRPDILYGQKRTAKLVWKDIIGSSKGKFVKTRKSTIGSKPTYFFTEKKGKKSKSKSTKSLLRL